MMGWQRELPTAMEQAFWRQRLTEKKKETVRAVRQE